MSIEVMTISVKVVAWKGEVIARIAGKAWNFEESFTLSTAHEVIKFLHDENAYLKNRLEAKERLSWRPEGQR